MPLLILALATTAWTQTRSAWLQAHVPADFCQHPHYPVSVTFTGFVRETVPTPAPGAPRPTHYMLSYRLVRSDGAMGPVQVWEFTQTGTLQTHPVSASWTLWRPIRGWEYIQILGNPPARSGTASFSLTCGPARHPSPAYASTGGNRPRPAAAPVGLVLRAGVPADFCHDPRYPVTVTFQGSIPAPPNPTTLSYRFVRSDGASGPVHTLRFITVGAQPVRSTWTLWHPLSGWVAIEVLAPVHSRSAPASFNLNCGPANRFVRPPR